MYRLKNSVYVVTPDLYVLDDFGNLVGLEDPTYAQLLYSVYSIV